MKFVQAFGLAAFLCSVSFVLASGIGIPKKEDVPKYLKQLQTSTSAAERAKAAEMLGKRGAINANDVEDAIEPLKKALEKDKDASVRAKAAGALGEIHSDAEGTVPLLLDRLKNDSATPVKMASVVALGQFGSDAKDALPTLREMLTKFDTKAAKKSNEAQTINNAIQAITGMKKKKN
jgi:HEAT repeat protein